MTRTIGGEEGLRSSCSPCPEFPPPTPPHGPSAPASTVIIVMVINPLGPSLQSTARWHSRGRRSHYQCATVGPAHKLPFKPGAVRWRWHSQRGIVMLDPLLPELTDVRSWTLSLKKSLQEKNPKKTSRCSLIPASVEKIDARICAGGGSQEAFHVRSTAESFLFTPTTATSPTPARPPRGCDPGAESNARTDLRKLNAGRQQRFITRAALRMGRE